RADGGGDAHVYDEPDRGRVDPDQGGDRGQRAELGHGRAEDQPAGQPGQGALPGGGRVTGHDGPPLVGSGARAGVARWVSTTSRGKNRSRVQSSATRSFFSSPGSFPRYAERHSSQASRPAKRRPRICAAPCWWPRATSRARVRNRNGVGGRPRSAATMLSATALPSRRACWAVGG